MDLSELQSSSERDKICKKKKKIFLEYPDMVVRDVGESTHSHSLLSQRLYALGKPYSQVERVDQLSLFNRCGDNE